MSDTPIIIGQEEFRDQRKRMIEDWGVPEEQANEMFTDVKTHVSLHAQELDKGWDNETLEAVTNLVIAIQQQPYSKQQQRRVDFLNRLYGFITGMMQFGFASAGVYLLLNGFTIVGAVLFFLALGSVITSLYN